MDTAPVLEGATHLGRFQCRSTEGPRRLAVCLRLIKPDGEVSKASPVQHSPQALPTYALRVPIGPDNVVQVLGPCGARQVWTCPESRIFEELQDGAQPLGMT